MKSKWMVKLESIMALLMIIQDACPHGTAPHTTNSNTLPWHPKCPVTLDT